MRGVETSLSLRWYAQDTPIAYASDPTVTTVHVWETDGWGNSDDDFGEATVSSYTDVWGRCGDVTDPCPYPEFPVNTTDIEYQ